VAPNREHDSLIGERSRIVNRMKAALVRLGIRGFNPNRLLKKGRLPLTLNCESDSYANKGMAGGIDARFGYADG
jgi:hypothetical protein